MDKKLDIKELFYEADTRAHQQEVCRVMIKMAKKFLDRAISHDSSKHEEPERSHYIEPVFVLNTEEVPYGSKRYKEVTAQMGVGWDHHKLHNDHHPEFFGSYVHSENDPLKKMNLFSLMEMLCDWIAASKRRNNRPELALEAMAKKYPIDEQVYKILSNTLAMLEEED